MTSSPTKLISWSTFSTATRILLESPLGLATAGFFDVFVVTAVAGDVATGLVSSFGSTTLALAWLSGSLAVIFQEQQPGSR